MRIFTIRGRPFRFRRSKMRDYGSCTQPDPARGKPGEIVVRSGLTKKSELDTIAHEVLHAACWDLDETAVAETARDLANILWSLGYRKGTA